MANNAYLKINDYETSLINEISAISTFKPPTVRSILESAFLRQLESLLSGEDINIPYIGTLHVDYNGDDYVSGAKVANITFTVNASDLFKRLAGEIHDGESDIIWQLHEKRISSALKEKLDE